MSLWNTDTPDYATPDDRPTPWQWLQSLIGPTAMRCVSHAAARSNTDIPSQLRTWLYAMTRTKTPAYHLATSCNDEPSKSPDERSTPSK